METFRYSGDDERELPTARLIVKPGDTFEVDDEVAKGLVGQEHFEKVKPKSKAAATVEKESDR